MRAGRRGGGLRQVLQAVSLDLAVSTTGKPLESLGQECREMV